MQQIIFGFLVFIAIIFTHCSQSQGALKPSGEEIQPWQIIWEENFDQSTLDTNYWNVIKRNTADWGNYMSDSPDLIEIKDGFLFLKGRTNPDRSIDTATYHTGGVNTKGKFAFQFGKIELRVKLENATGAWPALWMLADQPKYGAYPRNGEIDLMEHLNYEQQIYQTVHSYYTLELKQDNNPPHYATTGVDPEEFNLYGLEWFSDKLVFTVNGQETFIYPRWENVDSSQWPFDQPFYLLVDMQLGGSWVGKVDPADLPTHMIVDWIRVYQQ
ncbi:MAG: glycoside hydrolase family 16 protein [Saprospiraceae bacterium]|nr:glycoside hydrolase family 16 protein [Saprospiraceae bacterium]